MPKQVSVNTALSEYDDIRLTRLREGNRRQHQNVLEAWRQWVIRETQPGVFVDDIEHTTMARYFARLSPPRIQESTFNSYRQILVSFWDYCLNEGWVRRSPMRYVEPKKVPEKRRLRLSAEELKTMLDVAPNPRDRAVLAVGMDTFLRKCDVSALTVGDVNLHDNYISAFVQKTQRQDELVFYKFLRGELLTWLDTYAALMFGEGASIHQLKDNWVLLPQYAMVSSPGAMGFTHRRLEPEKSYWHLERVVQTALTAMSLPTKYQGMHLLRRSGARVMHDELLAAGETDAIRIVQAQLGHKSQLMTERYLGLEADRVRRDDVLSRTDWLNDAAEREQERNANLDINDVFKARRNRATG